MWRRALNGRPCPECDSTLTQHATNRHARAQSNPLSRNTVGYRINRQTRYFTGRSFTNASLRVLFPLPATALLDCCLCMLSFIPHSYQCGHVYEEGDGGNKEGGGRRKVPICEGLLLNFRLPIVFVRVYSKP